jgi:hypothetical protein
MLALAADNDDPKKKRKQGLDGLFPCPNDKKDPIHSKKKISDKFLSR